MAGEAEESPATRRAMQTEKKLRDNLAMEEIWKKIPKEIIRPSVNRATGKTEKVHFKRGAFLGKGGFARVYELHDVKTGVCYAGKIISKKSLTKPRSRQKLVQEIRIHKALDHDNIVRFVNFVEDKDFVYIILEMCSNRSLLRMIRTRKHICEAELRYYLHQMVSGLSYLKGELVIHRDLKLGNLFLDHNMTIKMGDFGLAAKLENENERKKTICGTPNYIAPEVLQGGAGGHSFEVDVWSLGVVMYTLLVGRPPFETSNLKATYKKIATNSYAFPADREDISAEARDLIKLMLNQEPAQRPPIEDIKHHPFLTNSLVPAYVPKASMICLPQPRCHGDYSPKSPTHYWMESPASSQKGLIKRKPIKRLSPAQLKASTEAKARAHSGKDSGICAASPRKLIMSPNSQMTSVLVAPSAHIVTRVAQLTSPTITGEENSNRIVQMAAHKTAHKTVQESAKGPVDKTLLRLSKMLTAALEQVEKAADFTNDEDILHANTRARELIEATANRLVEPGGYEGADPNNASLQGNVMVARWVDYSSKYGLVYQLSNLCTGISFIDDTKVVFDAATNTVDYYVPQLVAGQKTLHDDRHFRFHFSEAPPSLKKKMDLLVYFVCFYSKKKVDSEAVAAQMGEHISGVASPIAPMVYVQKWTRKKNAVLFRLSDGNVQANFLDHNKVLIWAGGAKLIYVNARRSKLSYDMSKVLCAPTMAKRAALKSQKTTRQDLQGRLAYVKEMMLRLSDGGVKPLATKAAKTTGTDDRSTDIVIHRPRTHRILIPTQ